MVYLLLKLHEIVFSCSHRDFIVQCNTKMIVLFAYVSLFPSFLNCGYGERFDGINIGLLIS